jgi:hypothetical protein
MAGEKGPRKRGQSTGEGSNIDNPPVEEDSPTKRVKKGNPKPKTPSPVKGRKGKPLKDKHSDSPSRSNVKSPSKGEISKPDPFRTPSPTGQPASSPLTTPKTPRAASKLGIPADVAKKLKYTLRLNLLVGMIYAVTQYFTEKNEDMPSREASLPILVNSLVRSPMLFKTYC